MADAGLVGELVGHFRVVSMIGRGSAGEVYVAQHEALLTRVAIKALHADVSANPDHVRRFFDEAIAASRIRHAGTVKIFDAGWLPSGRAYLVMELLEGETLRLRIARVGRLTLAELADITRQTANVLAATHGVGIVHRDLKPDNVILVPDAELASGERVRLLDFGIAKLADSEATASADGFMGTPDYMSPEQWQDSRAVDGRADAYSLGCVAFEMATGRVPFPSASVMAACRRHLLVPPPSVRHFDPELPEELDGLISRLLSKRADDRPAMQEVEDALSTLTAVPRHGVQAAAKPVSAARATVLTGDGGASVAASEHRGRSSGAWIGGSAAIAAVLFCVLWMLRLSVAQGTPVSQVRPSTEAPPRYAFAVAAPHTTHRSVTRAQARVRGPAPALRVAARSTSIPRGRRIASAPHPIDPYADVPSEPQPIDPYADPVRER